MKNTGLRRTYLFLLSLLLLVLHFPITLARAVVFEPAGEAENPTGVKAGIFSENSLHNLYDSIHLKIAGLSRTAYDYAIMGWQYLMSTGEIENPDVLSVIDFSLPSNQERLFVIDLLNRSLSFHTYVAHGQGSGGLFAFDFSNQPFSFKSSLGFYTTEDTYSGKHGLSLKLKGLEPGFNHLADKRSIVMHAAPYVSEAYIRSKGYLGRSQGCPAIPENISRPLIEKISHGSCLFIYGPNHNYLQQSKFLQGALAQ